MILKDEMVIPRAFRYNDLVCVTTSEGVTVTVPKSPWTMRKEYLCILGVYWDIRIGASRVLL